MILLTVVMLIPFTMAVVKIGGGTSTEGVRINPLTDDLFNNAIGSCSAGQFVYGFDGSGVKLCDTPAGSGTDTNCSVAGSCSSVAYMNYGNTGNFSGIGASSNNWIKNWTGIQGRNGNFIFRLFGVSTNAFLFQDSLSNNLLRFSGSQGVTLYYDIIPSADNIINLGEIGGGKNFATVHSYNYANDTHSYTLGQLALFYETQGNYYNKTDVYNKSEVLGFGYYNLSSFNINDYYLKSNPFGFYNVTTLPAETDPKWTANQTNYYNQTQSNATYVKKAGDIMTGSLTINAANLYLNTSQFLCWGNSTNNCYSNITNNGTHSIWF